MISSPRGVTGRAENVSDLVRNVGGSACGPGPGQREPAFPSPRSQPRAARGPQHAALTTARALRGLRPPNHPQRQSSALHPTRATTPLTRTMQPCSRSARAARGQGTAARAGEAAGSQVPGHPAHGSRRGAQTSLLLPRLGNHFSRPEEARAGRRPGLRATAALSGSRGDSHSGGRGPGRAGLRAGCRVRGGRRREETPAPSPRLGPRLRGPVLTLASWQQARRCPDAHAGRRAGRGGLARTAGRREAPREPGLGVRGAALSGAGRRDCEPR